MMKERHIPNRMCVGCRSRKRKETLLRFHRNSEGVFEMSKGTRMIGRGIYLCAERNCFEAARKKSLKGSVLIMEEPWATLYAGLTSKGHDAADGRD